LGASRLRTCIFLKQRVVLHAFAFLSTAAIFHIRACHDNRRGNMSIVLPLFASVLVPPPYATQEERFKDFRPPPAVVFRPDLTYGWCGKVNKCRLELDIAVPKAGMGPFPAVVVLHGTGPLTNGRWYNRKLICELANRGYVGVAVTFRHKPEDCFPAPCHDVKCAVRWLRANAAKHQIDPKRIGAIGCA
jgi:acetyl esterase/lipase